MNDASDIDQTTRRRILWHQARADLVLWLGLLAGVLCAIIARHEIGGDVGFGLLLLIAAVQIALVSFFFLQLREAKPLIRLTAGSAFVFLLAMFSLTLIDVYTRL